MALRITHFPISPDRTPLLCGTSAIRIMACYNGCGFHPDDPALALKQGVGLQQYSNVLRRLGGTLRIASKLGEGTRIVASCPSPNGKKLHAEAYVTVPLLPDKEVT